MDQITFKDLPISPSVNRCFQSVMRGRHSTIIATKEFRTFKMEMVLYHGKRTQEFKQAKEIVNQWLEDGFVLRFDLIFILPKDRLFTKTKTAKNKFKRIDADNRIKPMQDAVSEMLAIDDSNFFESKSVKMIGNKECMNVTIQKATIKTIEGL
jgi:Holliday junction resolvase RusA-like endonuclease